MTEQVLSMHLDLNEGSELSIISSEAVILDGEAKLYLNVSWDSAFADELSIEVNESSVSKIITSDMPDAAKLLKTRRTGIMFDSIEAALGSKYGRIYGQLIRLISSAIKNTSAFKKADVPKWYAPAA
ncbi:MAG: hypothetical protein E7194_10135 [Erysipelotrichaceae bacterium]|jgi:hypothetical protein|nr:hypothetical protein [Erysipelotrichaceae bacterium]